jgi:3-methyladenine DNA glycosylase AlkD
MACRKPAHRVAPAPAAAAHVAEALDVRREVAALTGLLATHADPERARFEKAYMKSALAFLGAGNPAIRRVAAEWSRAHRDPEPASLRALVEALVRSDVFDERSLGIAILARFQRSLGRDDLPWMVELCRHTAAWAHVDWLATDPISDVVGRDPGALPILRRWAKDPSFWVRRTAILAQLRQMMRGGGDFALFTEITTPLLEEKEFFVRKAIGWALRALSKKRPDLVRAYVEAHGDRMSGVTWREAVKYLDPPPPPRAGPSRRPRAVATKKGAKRG